MDNSIRTYSADSVGFSLLAALRAAATDIYSARYVVWQLFVRDFLALFRQKLLGYFWAVLSPLIGATSFVFMAMTGYLTPGTLGMPYPVFVFVGLGMWGMMIAVLQSVAGGLLNNGDLLVRTNVPPIALAVGGLATHAYNIIANTVVLGLLMLAIGHPPSIFILAYPLLILPLVMLGLGLGLFLAVVGTVARDITTAVVTILSLLMYLTPVIYEAKFSHPLLKLAVELNPLTHLIDMVRNLVCLSSPGPIMPFFLSTLFAMLVLALGIHSFYLIKDKAAERL